MNNIHPTVLFFGDVEIGENVRIDAHCIFTGDIKIGSHIHIAAGCYFFGKAGIILEDFVQIAPRLTVESQTDDFYGNSMVGPQIPEKYKPNLRKGVVTLKRHVLTGVGVTVMPGVTIGEGVSVGAHSFVHKDCEPWSVYAGIPSRRIGERSNKMLELERQFLAEWNSKINS